MERTTQSPSLRRILTVSQGLCLVLALAGCQRNKKFEGEIHMSITKGGQTSPMHLKVKDSKIRFDWPGKANSHSIYDPSQTKMVMVVDDQKAYMEMDFSAPSSAPSTDPGTSKLEKTGDRDTVAGRKCEMFRVTDASKKRTEVCFGEGLVYFDMASLSPGGRAQTGPAVNDFIARGMFPLRSIDYDADGKEVSRSEVTQVHEQKLDAALFVVPAGYQRVERPTDAKK
jgi:hypothetical protein